MITVEKVLRLSRVPLFAGLGTSDLGRIAELAEELTLSAGTVLFSEGDEPDGLFVVLEGRVRIERGGTALAVLEEGACLGEMGLLDGEPRSASATAIDDGVLLWIAREDFEDILVAHREVALAIVRVLCARLRDTSSAETVTEPADAGSGSIDASSSSRRVGSGGIAVLRRVGVALGSLLGSLVVSLSVAAQPTPPPPPTSSMPGASAPIVQPTGIAEGLMPNSPASSAGGVASALPTVGPTSSGFSGHAFALRVSQRSTTTVRRLRDSLATRALVHLDYQEGQACAGLPTKLEWIDGLDGVRALCRRDGLGARTLELGWSVHPAGGFELHVRGVDHAEGPREPNPDLTELHALGTQLTSSQPEAALHELAVEVVTLSHAQSDRALGLLKAVGYSTIEYKATQGEGLYERVYEPLKQGQLQLPIVVKVLDPPKTSLMDRQPNRVGGGPAPPAGGAAPGARGQGVPDLGGSFLHQVTADDPLQRLLVMHDADDPEPLRKLLRFLHETVDVAARQISVEALVLEVDTDKLRDVGVEFEWMDAELGSSFQSGNDPTQTPFTFLWDKAGGLSFGLRGFSATLTALVKSGHAEILSNPSVLVLDGRQARIQIGQRVPIVTSTATANTVAQRVDYETVGIVLNIRPRLDEKNNQVSMQVETIVSAIAASVVPTVGDTIFAPTFENRHVQSFVRVPDSTPFIVGGLISEESKEEVRRVPGLSRVPLLGHLFKRKIKDGSKREVIIVITPHVLPAEDKNFSKVIPKESDSFDSFDNVLFRNTYRIREQEVFDLSFVSKSATIQELRERVEHAAEQDPELLEEDDIASFVEGRVPGEEVFVRRMLWETIRSTESWKHVDPERLIYFVPGEGAGDLELRFLHQALGSSPEQRPRRRRRSRYRRPEVDTRPRSSETLFLSFDAIEEGSLPTARIDTRSIAPDEYREQLVETNARDDEGSPSEWTVVLPSRSTGSFSPLDFLRSAVVLRQLLELNGTLPQHVDEFYAGRQLVYPSASELQQGFHVVDAHVARLFFEIQEYYLAFEQEFNHRSRAVREHLEERG
ncbi:MAG: cyclic nucleotide-binding domain-containing protein [Acidobacteriota bacterium]